jgi:hypothetical protein
MNELNSEARKNILIENKVRAKFGGQLNTKAAKKQFSDELNKQGVRTVEQIKEARRLLL